METITTKNDYSIIYDPQFYGVDYKGVLLTHKGQVLGWVSPTLSIISEVNVEQNILDRGSLFIFNRKNILANSISAFLKSKNKPFNAYKDGKGIDAGTTTNIWKI